MKQRINTPLVNRSAVFGASLLSPSYALKAESVLLRPLFNFGATEPGSLGPLLDDSIALVWDLKTRPPFALLAAAAAFSASDFCTARVVDLIIQSLDTAIASIPANNRQDVLCP